MEYRTLSMEDKASGPIRRYPVVSFYLLAFAISWLGWFPQTLYHYGLFPFDSPLFTFAGAAGPTLAAVIVLWRIEGRDSLPGLFARLFQRRASRRWYLFVFLFWFAAPAVALGLGTFFGQAFPSLSLFAWPALLPVFLTMLLSNVWEEIGWRGFALPRLQGRYSDLSVTFIMGLSWSMWHLPLLLDPFSPMAALPWPGEILFSLALTVIYVWLYNNTGGSLLFVTIFHAMSNTVAFVLLELGVFESSYPFVVGVTALAALSIVLIYGPRKFGRGQAAFE